MKLLKRGNVTVETIEVNTQSYPNIAAMYSIYIAATVLKKNIKVTLGGQNTIQIYLRDISNPNGVDNPTIFSTGHLWKKFCYDHRINILISEYDFWSGKINVVFFNSDEAHNKVVYQRTK